MTCTIHQTVNRIGKQLYDQKNAEGMWQLLIQENDTGYPEVLYPDG